MRTLVFLPLLICVPATAQEFPPQLTAAMETAGENRSQLIDALSRVAGEQKEGMEFLIRWMPDRDLKTLTADFLVENVKLAYASRAKLPWGKSIPKDIFLNDVLPYANINEARDPWREDFTKRFLPLVAECKTATEAAQKLNATIFGTLKVRYSTKRRKADQSPKESMESGLASCTGLSIVLADACRAVCVPARLAGIPQWANKNGNHTWIEVWDKGWQFTGAAEYNKDGLNRTWFQGDAAQAEVDSRMSAIYAASYKKTGTTFPLIWAPKVSWVNAVNVTNRYTPNSLRNAPARLMVRVWNNKRTERVAVDVNVTAVGNRSDSRSSRSRDEGFDTNDILTFDVKPEQRYRITVVQGLTTISQAVLTGDKKQIIVDVVLPAVNGS